MGNFLALCTVGEIQTKEALLREDKVLQIMMDDGKIMEFRTSVLVRDLLVNNPNFYVGLFKEATQALPLDYKLKIGKIYYLLPSLDPTISNASSDEKTREVGTKRITVVITKEQLNQLLAKQGRIEDVLLGVAPKQDSGLGFGADGNASIFARLPRLESIPEGSELICY